MRFRTVGPSSRPSVVGLFRPSSPTAVLGRIRSIVVDPFDGEMHSRAFTHVSKECLIAGAPSVTDNNSPPAIVRIVMIPRTLAAILHCLPNHVFGIRAASSGAPNAGAVPRHYFAGAFTGIASARIRITAAKIPASNKGLLPAIAPAQPSTLPATATRSFAEDGKASESFPCNILKGWHCSVNSTLLAVAGSL